MSVVGSIPMHFRQNRPSTTVPRTAWQLAMLKEANMFGIGMPELLVILVIILIIFGAGKLPQIGEGLGKGIRNFRKATTKEPDEIEGSSKRVEEKKSEETVERK